MQFITAFLYVFIKENLPQYPAEILGEPAGAILNIRNNALLRNIFSISAKQFVDEPKETLAVREMTLSYQLGEFGVAADGAYRIHRALVVEAEHILKMLNGHARGVQQTARKLLYSTVAFTPYCVFPPSFTNE